MIICVLLLLLLYLLKTHIYRVIDIRWEKKRELRRKKASNFQEVIINHEHIRISCEPNDPMINLNFFSYPFSFSLDYIMGEMNSFTYADCPYENYLHYEPHKVQLLIIIFPPLSFISHLAYLFEVKYECRVWLWIAFLAPPPSLIQKGINQTQL